MPSLPAPLLRALASGATVVTPNRRLARGLVALHDRHEREAGRVAWESARALPWDAWLPSLWQDAMLADALPPGRRLRTPAQSAHAWSRIVAAHAAPLIDGAGAAALAADAWSLVHTWGAGGPSWRGWADAGDSDDDPAAFARWANRYTAGLGEDGVDAAQLADMIAVCAPRVAAWQGARFVLAGFVEFSPQQERLLAALAAAGADVSRQDTLRADPGHAQRAEGETPRDEIGLALAWARERALAMPDATIGIVVEDLALRRDEIRALADDVLCPALQWPDALASPRPYNLSLGAPLSGIALVAAALDLVAWIEAPLPVGRACALLRSPYVAVGADAWMRRARHEQEWLEQGRRDVTLRAAVSALRNSDRALAERWAGALERQRLPAAGSPRAFAEAWRDWLGALGWPGSRALDGAEQQARVAWDESLADFAALTAVEPRLARDAAVAALRAHVGAMVFQPETPPAPIQILGVLEAAGLPFDALWVAGLAAERWPAAPQPNPLLPIAWQRERGVPHASAARELAYSRAVTAQLARAAPEIVFSYAKTESDHPRSRSSLVPDGPALAVGAAPVPSGRAQYALKVRREAIADPQAPPIAAGARVRGGAGLIEAQSDCPFKAAATHRLEAAPWPAPIDGLSALERGTLVHAALAAFWADVGSHAALVALAPDALAAKIGAAVNEAIATLPAARWRDVLPVVAAGEAPRLASLVVSWLEAQERGRPPFTVLGVEQTLPLAAGGLTIKLRLDRVDALADGGTAIIDYKTGRTTAPDAWFDPRPQAPQLGLYALARRAAAPAEQLRAVAYAQVRTGETKVDGLVADAALWPALKLPSDVRRADLADWAAVEARWAESLGALAAEVAAGLATVTPRDPRTTCARCGLQPLCRIGALAIEDREGSGDE